MFIVINANTKSRLAVFRTHKRAVRYARAIKSRNAQMKIRIEREWYYSTRVFCTTLANMWERHQAKTYKRLRIKRDKIERKLAKFN